MHIGFDAKRAFHNTAGLGNYSRTIIKNLTELYSQHKYFLYNPNPGHQQDHPRSRFEEIKSRDNVSIVSPHGFLHKKFSSFWRSYLVTKDFNKERLDIFHGLSNELPLNIHKSRVKKIVTIHDLIFIRYPELYGFIDRKIYKSKVRYACKVANVVIAISEQTKNDLIEFLEVPEDKIRVIYQSCDEHFFQTVPETEKLAVKKNYHLPENFFLSVGTIEERKNQLATLKAMNILKQQLNHKLVLIGKATSYKKKLLNYLQANQLEDKVIFLDNVLFKDLPAIYQSAEIFLYPSLFEGFGIPIIEALFSNIPVITSSGSCFPEAGGPGSSFINPKNSVELANEIIRIHKNNAVKQRMVLDGNKYVQKFRKEKTAEELMDLYKSLLRR